jgi:predicted acyl esterase
VTSKLNTGSFVDDGFSSAMDTTGLWSISQPVAHDVWLSGEPVLDVTIDAMPRANLVATVYDISPDGRAHLISRGAHLVRDALEQDVSLELYGQDWPIAEGHRIGVKISSADSDWWVHIPTATTVTILDAHVRLPFLTFERTSFLDGKKTPRLKDHLSDYVDVDDQLIDEAGRRFNLPPRLRHRPI